MRVIIILVMFFLFSLVGLSQNQEITQLKDSLKRINNEENYSKLLYEIGAKVMIFDSKEASLYVAKLDSVYRKKKKKESKLYSLQLDAKILRWIDQPYKALEKYIEILKISKDSLTNANVEFNLGIIYTNLRMNRQAIDSFTKALHIYKRNKKNSPLPALYNCLADVYNYNLFDYKRAEEYYLQAISSYLFLDESEKNRTETLQTLSAIHNNLGRLYIYTDKFLLSEKHLIQSRAIALEMNDKIGVLHSNITLAELYRTNQKYKKAYDVLNSFENEYQEFALYLQAEYLREWSNALAGINDYQKAFFANKNYTKVQDSLYNSNLSAELIKLKNNFEEDIKKKEFDLEKTKYKYLFISVAICLLFIILLFHFKKRSKLKQGGSEDELTNENLDVKKSEFLYANIKENILENKILEITEKLETLKRIRVQDENLKSDLSEVISFAKASLKSESFQEIFIKVHNSFYLNLQEKHPNLTINEKKISALIKLKLSSLEISKILNIESNSVNVAKSRLRKRLTLQKGQDLYDYLDQF